MIIKAKEKKDKKDKKDKNEDSENSEEGKPTAKDIKFKLDDIPDVKNLRLVVHPELGALGEASKLADALVDTKAKFKNGVAEVTVQPVPEKVNLGEEGMAMLMVTLYQDVDKSKDLSDKDIILAGVMESPIYARKKNLKNLDEWTYIDLGTQQAMPIKKAIELSRVDTIEARKELEFGSKIENVDKEIGLLSVVSLEEAKDFSKNFIDAKRPLMFKVDRGEEKMSFSLKDGLVKERRSSKIPDYIPGFRDAGVSLLAGFKGGEEEISKDSKPLAFGCLKLMGESEDDVIYDAVLALWVEPKKNWIKDPAGAFQALFMAYNPGWNALGVQIGHDDSMMVTPIIKEDFGRISFDKGCKLEFLDK